MEPDEIAKQGARLEAELQELDKIIGTRKLLLKQAQDEAEKKTEQMRMLFRQKSEPELPFHKKHPDSATETTFKEIGEGKKLLTEGRPHKRYTKADRTTGKKKRGRKKDKGDTL